MLAHRAAVAPPQDHMGVYLGFRSVERYVAHEPENLEFAAS
jgi:hypothetical protein